jgi:hypothetical protein
MIEAPTYAAEVQALAEALPEEMTPFEMAILLSYFLINFNIPLDHLPDLLSVTAELVIKNRQELQ